MALAAVAAEGKKNSGVLEVSLEKKECFTSQKGGNLCTERAVQPGKRGIAAERSSERRDNYTTIVACTQTLLRFPDIPDLLIRTINAQM